ncbi:MAG TPA: helix-turn-helix transcriptional regulator [Pseudonocardiaceae bacterium]|nr:helix-turn-helix transcriptional regulator [Pseudonocardiaceae bacterium]
MVASSSPTALKRWIAYELRRLREASGRTRQEAAARVGRTVAQIGHLETGRNLPSAGDVEVLLNWYGHPDRIEFFRDLLKQAKKGRDWWIGLADAVPDYFALFLGLEASAAQLQSYDCVVVPGILQTHAYAQAVIRMGERARPDAEVARRVELRMARQQLIERADKPLQVWTVLDEAVLYRQVGGIEVMREQLERLVKLAERPNIDIQVLPATAGGHAITEGTFTLLTFPPELHSDPGVVYVETRVRGIYFEDPAEIQLYRQALTRLQVHALNPDESPAMIQRIADEYR